MLPPSLRDLAQSRFPAFAKSALIYNSLTGLNQTDWDVFNSQTLQSVKTIQIWQKNLEHPKLIFQTNFRNSREYRLAESLISTDFVLQYSFLQSFSGDSAAPLQLLASSQSVLLKQVQSTVLLEN